MFLLECEVTRLFEAWLPGTFIDEQSRRLLFDTGLEMEFRGMLNHSKTAREIWQLIRGGIGATKDVAWERFEHVLNRHMRFDGPVLIVGYYQITQKTLKHGSVKYRFCSYQPNLKLRKKFDRNHRRHLDTAARCKYAGKPLGGVVFP